MINKNIYLIAISLFLCVPLFAQQISLDSLDTQIQKLVSDFEVPGLSVGIVRNDSIIFTKGYGVLEIHKKPRVDKNTLFGIGSISKSFTALTLGMLVDEGKIGWDDKVTDYLPYFQLYDPYVTENFTIRDMLTHRSGLKDVSGGTLWYHSDYSRVDIIKRLKHLEPVSGFRDKPAYQNVMYVVASEIVKEVSGMTWDDFLKSRLLKPLDMTQTTSVSEDRESRKNLAQPHIYNEAYVKVAIPQEDGNNLAPGGFVYSSAVDMSNYMRLMLHDGVFKNDTIVKPKTIREMLKPQIIYPLGGRYSNEFTSYGFGWWLTPYKGHKIIEHSGGIDGMAAQLVMIKDLDIGFVILTNDADEPATFALKVLLLQKIIDNATTDFYTLVKNWRDKNLKADKEAPDAHKQITNTRPSLALNAYTGRYSDTMYGDILITDKDTNDLELSFTHTKLFKGRLTHWHFDTFKIDWYDVRVPDGFLTFNFNADRDIVGFSMDQDNLLDVDFSELEIVRTKN